MICPACGTDNRPGRKFCGGCAAPLAVVCPSCGAANEPDMRFCGECATPLGSASAPTPTTTATAAAPAFGLDHPVTAEAPVAERRVVSVLFADLVGFTTLAEGRDAEDTRELLSSYFELARDVIGRYGGTIEKFIGDAVMAVWGAPVAHEDDAERAVRAGLELVDAVTALGPGVAARAGVLTGNAAVTLGATNQGMVAGDLVNTASRLQSAAAPGTVLVGEATERAANTVIAFEPAGDQTLKGKGAPVAAWRALRVIARVGGRTRNDSLETPFVGRDEELRLLKDLFHATTRERRTRLVSVLGAAGIGKSRLAWEFLKYIDGLVELVLWHDGRSPAYGDGISFWALGEMVRERCGLVETDDEATTRARIADTLETYVPDPAERGWVGSALLALLGFETGIGSDQLFAAWRTFFERLAATGPVVMVFEDHHYADPGLLDFVDHLLEWSRNVPIYVVTLARPELLEKRPDWGAGKRNFASLYLEPLPDTAMRALLAGLVPGLPEAAVRAIIARADGIPLYAVETVRMLLGENRLTLEGGAYRPVGDLTKLAVPETLAALIASRLDGLAPGDRALVSHAAVLGQSFTVAALSAVSDVPEAELEPRLRVLVGHQLLTLEADPRSPERGQYSFVQALIREVAYETLAKRDRKSRHLAAARFFESLGSEELAGALAGHYIAAYHNAGDGPEAEALAAQARIALKAAADRAISLGSRAQAVAFLDQAREVTREGSELAELLERAGSAALLAGLNEISEDRLREAVELRRGLGDADALAGAIALGGETMITSLRLDAAVAALQAAVDELLGDQGEPSGPGSVALLSQLARGYFLRHQHRHALGVIDRALAAAERFDLVPIVSDALITRGSALTMAGRTYEGGGAIRTGVELADEHGLIATALRGRLNLGAMSGPDPRAAFDITAAGIETAMRFGLRAHLSTLLENLMSSAVEIGEWDRAFREVTAARDESPDQVARDHLGWVLVTIKAWRGGEVTAELESLTAWAESFDESEGRQELHRLRAEAAFGAGDFLAASDEWMAFARVDSLGSVNAFFYAGVAALMAGDAGRAAAALAGHEASPGHWRLFGLDRRLLRACLAALDGRRSEAVVEGHSVIDEYERSGLPWRQALAADILVRSIGGTASDLRDRAEGAREIYARLGAKPFLERLDALLRAPVEETDAHGGRTAAAKTTS